MVVVIVVVDVGVAVGVAFRRAVRTGLSMPMRNYFKNNVDMSSYPKSLYIKVNEL